MALTAGIKVDRRGPPRGNSYGYLVAPGEQVWRGSIVALNAAGQLQRVQTAGSLQIVGICTQDYSNVGNAGASQDYVVAERGCWQLTVPAAAPANINAPVYATDDNTFTLSSNSGANLQVGTLNGFEVNGLTYVLISGS